VASAVQDLELAMEFGYTALALRSMFGTHNGIAGQVLVGSAPTHRPSAAKLFCTEMAGNVADLAVQIHGGIGYVREVPVERIYREVPLLRLRKHSPRSTEESGR
jgi:alkylation response protein AidB-like acyl-CoA dehydrogenase